MTSIATNLGVAEWDGSQNTPNVPVNEGIALALTFHVAAVAKGTETPPGSPAEGDMHILGSTPNGAWAGFATDNIARYHNGSWQEINVTDATAIDRLIIWVDDGAGSSDPWQYDSVGSPSGWLRLGVAETVFAAGTFSGGTFNPNAEDGSLQTATNDGAHTLNPPVQDCRMTIQYTNGASAGTITTSGYTQVTGDALTTTNGDDFMFNIVVIGAFSHLDVVALQ